MSVPTYDQFIEPILRYLPATPEGAAARDAHEAAADALNLSEAQHQELITSGHGANRNDLQRVGVNGDGGIGGVISLDKFGLEKVYVQAKRWQGTVGCPELQAFTGLSLAKRPSVVSSSPPQVSPPKQSTSHAQWGA